MLVQQFLKSFRQSDDLEPGIFMKNDGTVWLRNPDGTETQLPGAIGSPPVWSNIVDGISINNGTVDPSNSYAYALGQPADPDGAFPSATSLWLRIVYGSYTGGGEAGTLTVTLPNGSAAGGQNYQSDTGEVSGMWSTGGIGAWDTFGPALWSSIDGAVVVAGSPVFDVGDILIAGMGIFPSF